MDAGNLFDRSRDQSRAELIISCYQMMQYDAINVAITEFALDPRIFLDRKQGQTLPFISANVIWKNKGTRVFPPFLVKEFGDLRVGIFGLTSKGEIETEEYVAIDPIGASKAAINEMKGKTDLIIALTDLDPHLDKALASEFPDIDMIIGTRRGRPMLSAEGTPPIFYTAHGGKYLGQVELSITELKRPLHLADRGRKENLQKALEDISVKIGKVEKMKESQKASDKGNGEKLERYLAQLIQTKRDHEKNLMEYPALANSYRHKWVTMSNAFPENPEVAKMISQFEGMATGRKVAHTQKGPGNVAGSRMASHLTVSVPRLTKDGVLVFTISVDASPNPIRSFGLDMRFENNLLKYRGFERGNLVKNFDFFDVSNPRPGLLRIGGFEARGDEIAIGISGELARITFDVLAKGDVKLKLGNLKDDIRGWLSADEKTEDTQGEGC